jgi:hypothetical protein
VPPANRAWRRGAATGLALLLCVGAALGKPASAAGFQVRSAETRLVDGVHLLDARIDFDFSDEATEAMRSGVALTVSVEMQVLRLSPVWDRRVAGVTARYRIQAHALSRQYLVRNLSTGETTTYRSFDEMVDRIGRIDEFPLLDDHVLVEDADYRARIRASLDLESLPTPLRLLAYFKPSWRLSSEWTSWPLQR